jgi:hypothetical protein
LFYNNKKKKKKKKKKENHHCTRKTKQRNKKKKSQNQIVAKPVETRPIIFDAFAENTIQFTIASSDVCNFCKVVFGKYKGNVIECANVFTKLQL